MQRVLMVSFGVHVVALASVLALQPPVPAEPDQPARIEVVFGTSGEAPPATAGLAVPVAASIAAPVAPQPPDADGLAESVPLSGAQQNASVRPPAPDPGLRVDRPDPQMIPAREAVGNHAPDYPEAARRMHQQGTVLLRLHIGTDGAVTRIELLQSSGCAALDDAARAALTRWRFLPAEMAGQPVASYRDQPVSFVL
jgi:protein TonB